MKVLSMPAPVGSASSRGTRYARPFSISSASSSLMRSSRPLEVVADHALARPGPLGDTGQGCLAVTQLGDGVDGGRHDLRPACGLDEGPVGGWTSWLNF